MKKRVWVFFISMICSLHGSDLPALKPLIDQFQTEHLTTSQFEQQIQVLAENCRDSSEKGTLYFQVAKLLSYKILNRDSGTECIKFANLALGDSKDVLELSRTYIVIANALETQRGRNSQEDLVKNRKEIVEYYLKAAALVIPNLKIKDLETLPVVSRYDDGGAAPDSHIGRQLASEHKQEWVRRQNAEFQNDLLESQKIAFDAGIRLYSVKPYNNNEFEAECQEILNNPELTRQLMERLKAKQADDDKNSDE